MAKQKGSGRRHNQVGPAAFTAKADSRESKRGPEEGGHPDLSIHSALSELQHALEKHRLTFLFFADAVRPALVDHSGPLERIRREEVHGGRIPPEAIDAEGRFLFEHQFCMNRFAQMAVSRFGLTAGLPGNDTKEGKPVENDGSRHPWWEVDEVACLHLEATADMILNAAKMLARLNTQGGGYPLVRKARNLAHDHGQTRWLPVNGVRWEYLAELDELIRSVKLSDAEGLENLQPEGVKAAKKAARKMPAKAKKPVSQKRTKSAFESELESHPSWRRAFKVLLAKEYLKEGLKNIPFRKRQIRARVASYFEIGPDKANDKGSLKTIEAMLYKLGHRAFRDFWQKYRKSNEARRITKEFPPPEEMGKDVVRQD